MAALTSFEQHYFLLRDGRRIGVHRPVLASASDTITVPTLANSNNNASSAQLRQDGEAAVTVTDDGSNTVTIVGTAGANPVIVTLHQGRLNSAPEA